MHRLFCDLAQTGLIPVAQYWADKRLGRTNEWILSERLRWDATAIDVFVERWMQLIETPSYLALDKPFAYAEPALRELCRLAELFVLTSRQDELAARAEVERAGFTPYLAEILVTGGSRSKADFLSNSDLDIGLTDIVVGDTGEDIKIARAFGARSVAVLSGIRDRETLSKYGPDAIFEDLAAFTAETVKNMPALRGASLTPRRWG
jgi:phosphoglycolate phosphatase